MQNIFILFNIVCLSSIPTQLLFLSLGFENRGLLLKEDIGTLNSTLGNERILHTYITTKNSDSIICFVCITCFSLIYILLVKYDEEHGDMLQSSSFEVSDLPDKEKRFWIISQILFWFSVYIHKLILTSILFGSSAFMHIGSFPLQDSFKVIALQDSFILVLCCYNYYEKTKSFLFLCMTMILYAWYKIKILSLYAYFNAETILSVCTPYITQIVLQCVQIAHEILLIIGHQAEVDVTYMTTINSKVYYACYVVVSLLFTAMFANKGCA